MKTANAATILGLLALTIPLSGAVGFNGERAGFVLGVAAGYGSLFQVSEGGPDVDDHGLLTELVLGHGFTDQLLVHYSGRQVWASHDGILYAALFPSLAGTYYMRPRFPSFYVTGSLGIGAAGDLAMEDGRGGVGGFAGFAGIGVELARHVELEAAAGLMDSESSTYGTVGITLKAIAY